jgi:hypothetical protein
MTGDRIAVERFLQGEIVGFSLLDRHRPTYPEAAPVLRNGLSDFCDEDGRMESLLATVAVGILLR